MLRTQGTLLVKRIKHSRNGPFCVADLTTDFGEFKVKVPLLDQFAEGEYHGTVWISEIYLAQYISFGRSVTELRARLDDIQVDTERGLPAGASKEPSEPDPADEVPPVRITAKADARSESKPKLRLSTKREASKKNEAGTNTADLELFGEEIHELVVALKPVKLDPTIDDRVRFRTQAARLGKLDFVFDPKRQTWDPPSKGA